jgi:hypothetical protein
MLSLACLLSASSSFAQTGTASLYGKVTDQQGAVLPGVTVTVTSTAAAVTRSTVSDATGNYQFLALPPGLYSVKVELTGFRTATRDSVELPGGRADQDGRADGDRRADGDYRSHLRHLAAEYDRRQSLATRSAADRSRLSLSRPATSSAC